MIKEEKEKSGTFTIPNKAASVRNKIINKTFMETKAISSHFLFYISVY